MWSVSNHRDPTRSERLHSDHEMERVIEKLRRRNTELEQALHRAEAKLRALLPFDENEEPIAEGEAW